MPRTTSLAAPPIALLLFATLATSASLGCRSTSTNVTGPSSTKCAVSLTGSGLSVPGDGGSGSISVSTNRECSWTATSQATWIAVTSGASGQGPGTVAFTASPNPASSPRTGAVVVNQGRVDITQQGAACSLAVDPSSVSVPASGGDARVSVQGPDGCAWTAQSAAPWVSVTQGASGSGSGSVTLAVAANSGAARSTTVTIAGRAVTVSQATGGCTFAVSLAPSSFGASGGTGQATVTAAAGCEWTASSNASWVTLTGAASGSGSGTFAFAVSANTGATRTASISVAGQTFTVTQASGASGCSVSASPRSLTVPGDGGTGDFTVSAGDGCGWTASSSASWLAITRGASGTGNGTVSIAASANTGAERSATVSIGNDTVSVVQAATACAYTVAPASITIGAAGGSASVSVNTVGGCAWSAASNATWITITAGSSGSGSGTASFSVAANTGAAREGTVLVAGRAVSVSQEGTACSFSLLPSGVSAPAAGGTLSTTLNTSPGCSWTASSNDAWITILRGATGTGTGTVEFAVAANPGGARTGTLTIAGLSFAVRQAAEAPACQYSLAPTSAAVPASGGTTNVAVTAGPGCAWTSVSNAPWVTVTGGASGSGNGTVSLTVAANAAAAPRDTTVSIAGLTFTVTQAGATCSYAITPTGASAPSGGGSGDVDVSTTTGCAWAASSNAGWLSISSGASGSGSGRVSYNVAANTGVQSRAGTLTIAGQPFSVTQDGTGCSYTVSPLAIAASSAVATYAVNVTAPGGCTWAASSGANWITVTAGATGTGSGTVTISVAVNTTGSQRSGTVTVAGQAVIVTQQ